MKQSRFRRRASAVGASSILAVAAVGLSAAPALAGTQHMRPGPRMTIKRGHFHADAMRPGPRMTIKRGHFHADAMRPGPRMT